MIRIDLFMDYEIEKKQDEFKIKRISFQQYFILIISLVLISFMLFGCGPSTEELEMVGYTPLFMDDWEVSTPTEQGLDPKLVAKLYYNAAELETLYGLLVIKNDI